MSFFFLVGYMINRYGNKILVTDELPDGQMVDQWEPVMPNSIKTPLEVPNLIFDMGSYMIQYLMF